MSAHPGDCPATLSYGHDTHTPGCVEFTPARRTCHINVDNDHPCRVCGAPHQVTSKLAARDCPPCGPCCSEHPHWSHVHTDQFVGPTIECTCGDVFRSVCDIHEHIHLAHPEADHD